MAEQQHAWEDVIDDEIRAVAGNYAARQGLRRRPALLVIDDYNAVFGDRREPLLEAMQRFPSSCGPAAWDAVEPTKQLIAAARAAGIPVVYTTRDLQNQVPGEELGSTKRSSDGGDPIWESAIFPDFAPQGRDLVIHKARASGFFGTPLNAHLIELGIDTLVVCGESTSGCVRATCVDAKMLGYKVGVVEECVFDRNWLSHKVNLFDLNCKYADVIFLDEAVAYLQSIREERQSTEQTVPVLA
jgi:nicotinamidase-related amidase